MARDYRKIGVVLGLCACALIGAERAQAQAAAADKAAAEALFDRGLSLMREGKYQEACERLEQSQAVERGIGTMLYLAECYEKTGRTASAWALFREASSWAQAAGQTERAEAGKRRAERLEKGLSRLTVQVSAANRVSGLELKDNGAPVNPSVWGVSVPVDPGMHRVEATAPGYRPWSGEVRVADNAGTAEIGVPALERLPASELAPSPAETAKAAPSAASAAPADKRMSTQRIIGLSVGSAGVAVLAIGAGFGIRAINKNDDAKELCDGGTVCDSQAGEDRSKQALSAARASNALLAIGGVMVIGGLVTYLVAPKERQVRVAAAGSRTGASVSLGGVF